MVPPMKNYLIRWKSAEQYGCQWVTAGSALEAKGKIKKEVLSSYPFDYMQIIKEK